MPTRRLLLQATAALVALPRVASAAGFPDRTVRVIVPYPPGGSTDITARLVGERMGTAFVQRFLIDNRPGAGGNLGMEAAAHAKPDG